MPSPPPPSLTGDADVGGARLGRGCYRARLGGAWDCARQTED